MNPCLECDITEKLEYCCHTNPKTQESEKRYIGNLPIYACPNLDEEGFCTHYENRPTACQEYQCHKFYELDLVDLLFKK